jgi:two-component SAPR family response regulator
VKVQEPLSLSGKRIRIGEDQYLIAADLSRALTKLGCVVVGPVASNEAARKHLAHSSVDFAFFEINLGEQLIFPLADELERRGLPFVFATGHDAAVLPERFKSKPCVEKPLTMQAVHEAVRQLNRAR